MADQISDAIRYDQRHRLLRNEQSTWRQTWSDVQRFLAPRRGRYLTTDTDNVQQNGAKKNQHVINGTAFKAGRTLGAGLQGGLTSPARPWFELTVQDQDLNGYTPVKLWLETVRDLMLAVFAGSNFYGSNHTVYEEIGYFGTGCMLIDEDFTTVINCRPFTIGEYCLSLDAQYRPSTLYRTLNLTVEQILGKFGPLENLPLTIQQAVQNKKLDQRHECLHVIEPSSIVDSAAINYRSMSYRSCYMLKGQGEEGILRKGGYRTTPFVAPRWAVYGVDTYGDSPGIEALGDVRMLQKMEEKKLRALDKEVDPPMVGPASLRGQGATTIPGGITFVDQAAGAQGFAPAFTVRMDIANLGLEIKEVAKRVEDFFYNDLFLAILNQTKEMTATEVAQRHEEKLVMLGPVLERIQSESLGVTIDRTFSIMSNFGMIPPPPPEIAGHPLQVNYISTLAQAQKLIGTSSLQQFSQFTGAIAPLMPDVIDRIDGDQLIMAYADATGVPPKIIRSDSAVAAIRAQKAKNLAAQNTVTSAPELAGAAKSASQAQLGKDQNLLQAVTGQAGGK